MKTYELKRGEEVLATITAPVCSSDDIRNGYAISWPSRWSRKVQHLNAPLPVGSMLVLPWDVYLIEKKAGTA